MPGRTILHQFRPSVQPLLVAVSLLLASAFLVGTRYYCWLVVQNALPVRPWHRLTFVGLRAAASSRGYDT